MSDVPARHLCDSCIADVHSCGGWWVEDDDDGVPRWRDCLCEACCAKRDDPPYDLGRADGDPVGQDPMTKWRERDEAQVHADDLAAYKSSIEWARKHREEQS